MKKLIIVCIFMFFSCSKTDKKSSSSIRDDARIEMMGKVLSSKPIISEEEMFNDIHYLLYYARLSAPSDDIQATAFTIKNKLCYI